MMDGRGLGQWQAYCVAAPTHAAALAAGAAQRAQDKQERRARVREGLGLGG